MLFTAAYTQYTGTITWNPAEELNPPSQLDNLLIFNQVEDGTYITTEYLTPDTNTTFSLSNLTIGTIYNIEINNYTATGVINELDDSQIDLTVIAGTITDDTIPDSDEESAIPMEIETEILDDVIPSMVIDEDPEDEEPEEEGEGQESDLDPGIDEDGGGDDSIDDLIIDIPETLTPDEISFLREQALEDINALIDEWMLRGVTYTYNGVDLDAELIDTDTSLVPGPNLTVDAEISSSISLNGKTVNQLQEDINIDMSNEVITGTLKYVEDYTGYDQEEELQSGYYLALHVDSDTESFTPIIRASLDKTIDVTRNGYIVLRVNKESVESGNRYITLSLLQNDNGNEIYWIQFPLLVNVDFEEHEEI